MKRAILPILLLLIIMILVVIVPDRVAALTVQVWKGEPPPASGGTQMGSNLTTVVNDPENGNKRTIFLSTPPTLPSDCAGAPRNFTLSGVTFRFSDLTRSGPDSTCPNGRIFIDTTVTPNRKARARVYVDNSNLSLPKMVLIGKITMMSGNAATVTVRATSSSGAGDYASNTNPLAFGASSKGVFKRSGLSTDTSVTAPTTNAVKVTTRANPSNVVNTPGSTAPTNSLSTSDPPSASIPPSTFQAGAGCTTVGTTKACSASFDIADTESNISCSSTPCPIVQTDWTYGFNRNGDSMEKKGSGVTAFGESLGAVLGALEQCNVWASNPAVLGTRIIFLQPSPGSNNSNGERSLSGKAAAVVSGGDFFLASPLSGHYVTMPGSSVNDEESVVVVVPARETLVEGQKVCNLVSLADFDSLQATYAFKNGTDCKFSSYRFDILFDNGQTAHGMYGEQQGQFFNRCRSNQLIQSGLNFVTNPEKNWQLGDGSFMSFEDLKEEEALSSAKIASLRLVLDLGLSDKQDNQDAGFQLVDLDQVSYKLKLDTSPVVFAPPPAGQETPILDLPQAAAVVTNLTTGQTFVVEEAEVNINNSQWVFHVPMSSLFGAGDYAMRMCLAQLCPDDPVAFSVFDPGKK